MNKALLTAICCLGLLAAANLRAAGTLDIYWIDSEGGGSTLIVTPSGESILVDSGNPGGRDPARIHKVASQVAGLKKIDHLVTTHFDIDHFGGASELAELMPIGRVYDNGSSASDPNNLLDKTYWPKLIAPYRAFKADGRKLISPGDEIKLAQPANGPALRLRCVAARQKFIDAPAGATATTNCDNAPRKPADKSDNANSIALLLEYGNFRFFDGADLTWNVEADLVCPVNRVGQVDVFQVNHHGLDISNNPLLVNALAPVVSIMCNGPRKGAATPTMATLRSTPSIQAQYALHRNMRSANDNPPDEFIANPEEKCQANYVMLSVAPGAQSYTVSIPATGHKRTFKTRAR